jgi:hypothetical protein
MRATMSMRSCGRLALALGVALLAARSARAQALCAAIETVQECTDRLTEDLGGTGKSAAAKSTLAREQADVKKKTETSLQDLNGLSTSLKDFLPLLQIAGALGDVKTDETTGAVSVALNTRFLGSGGTLTQDPSLQIKAVVETKPKLFDQLRSQLPEGSRDALEKQLLTGKPDAEHTTLHASYNVTSRKLGRNFAMHMALYNDLFEAAAAPPTEAGAQAVASLARELRDALGDDVDPDSTLWGEIPVDKRSAAEPIIVKNARALRSLDVSFRSAVNGRGLDLFGQLINNQPQLTITASRSFRDDLFGPDVWTVRAVYEKGLGNNLNGFFKELRSTDCSTERTECLKKYSSYANDPGTRARIKAASRLAFSVEVSRHQAYDFQDVARALALALPERTVVAGALDFGRLVGVDEAGVAEGRIDGSVRFEHRSETVDETRFVASLTLTKKVGQASIPLQIVYANKDGLSSGVDKGLTVTAGLKFNLFGAR